MINHGKRHLLLSTKVAINVSIGDVSFTTIITETLLGILIDPELSHDSAQKFTIKDFFSKCDQHLSSICSKASKKLHALGRISGYIY